MLRVAAKMSVGNMCTDDGERAAWTECRTTAHMKASENEDSHGSRREQSAMGHQVPLYGGTLWAGS